ncbi:hypothetical protein RJT34_32640 [Clitoria ternatea]|uniref:Uncharacterized protein n=1 Tax=Clitoria ternatea TaxID=43366 RepID=A0AAN9EXU7_CLITE
MYSSSINTNDLISYPNQPFCFKPFSFESNSSKPLESNSNYALPPELPLPPSLSSLSFFQSPFDENIFLEHNHDLFSLHNQSLADHSLHPPPANINNMDPSPIVPAQVVEQFRATRRRSTKRDRHSKINTARGLRDRRMRLSLEVAKRFFGLQDMLGFDKASKTVEWLLNQAKVEIKQLARDQKSGSGGNGDKSASSTSECEGVSGLDEVVVSGIDNQEDQEVKEPHMKRRGSKVCRKSSFNFIGKESREKARERARERTREKMRTRRLAHDASNNLNRLSSWNPFEIVEDSGGTQSQSVNMSNHNHASLDVHLAEAEEPSSRAKEHLGTVEDMAQHEDHNSLVINMSKWSPTMMFNSFNNSSILHEHQFAEFHALGKPWEAAYNNHI